MQVTRRLQRHIEIVANYEHFFAGSFLRDASREDVNFVGIWTTLRF